MLKRLRKYLLSYFLSPQSYLQNPYLSSVSVLNNLILQQINLVRAKLIYKCWEKAISC